MKKLLALFTLVLSFGSSAQDPGVGQSHEQLELSLRGRLNYTRSLLISDIESRQVAFDDYKIASKMFLSTIDKAKEKFEKNMLVIHDFLAEYEAVSQSTDNRAMEQLLEMKEEEFSRIRRIYFLAAKKLITLQDSLSITTSDKLIKRRTKDISSIYSNGKCGVKLEGAARIQKLFSERKIESEACGYTRKEALSKLNMGLQIKKEIIDFQHAERFSRHFEQCETQGCVYYLAEDISLWIRKAQELLASVEIKLEGLEPLEGPKFVTKFKEIQFALDSHADEVARELPTGIK